MEIFAQIIDSLAWPVAAVWLAYLFRGGIQNLLGRINKLIYKDLKLILKKRE
ncbi:MAG: hypothetical protein ACI8PD_002280 [Nitrospinales bacterium]|jgi:hypothetical protein